MKSHTLSSPKNHHLILTFVFYAFATPIFPQNKLAPRSTPCIFLGYPSNHHGYRCFNHVTCQIIISHHITFDKHSLPCHSMLISLLSTHSLMIHIISLPYLMSFLLPYRFLSLQTVLRTMSTPPLTYD